MTEPAADRRGQAAVEYVALIALTALLIAGAVVMTRSPIARVITGALEHPTTTEGGPSPEARDAIAGALTGAPDAPTLLGARARLAEEIGPPAADRIFASALQSHLIARHGPELASTTLSDPIGDAGRLVAVTTHHPRLRLISPADEARSSLVDHDREDRDRAAATVVAWSTLSTALNGLRRHLGSAASALRLVLDASASHDPLPPGARAGDLVACLPVVLRLTGRPDSLAAWRIVILRRDRVVADRIDPTPTACAGPADVVLPTGPEYD
jgi:Flp pilus assembly pilin Flp